MFQSTYSNELLSFVGSGVAEQGQKKANLSFTLLCCMSAGGTFFMELAGGIGLAASAGEADGDGGQLTGKSKAAATAEEMWVSQPCK